VESVEQKVCQGIVDDAAAICGAVLAELRLRSDLLAQGEDSGPEGGDLVQAALGGSLVTGRKLRDQTARRLREPALRELFPGGARVDKHLRLARCAPGTAEALDLGGLLGPTLWYADVPLTVDGETAGTLRVIVDGEPRRPLLRALRGIGPEASNRRARGWPPWPMPRGCAGRPPCSRPRRCGSGGKSSGGR
jgi:hypothetical protein